MESGLVLIDKPVGPTSHDVVARTRRSLGTRRVGHAGTLDPFASGLLLVLVGRATRLARFLTGLPKSYRGTLRLGEQTDSDDLSGEVIRKDEEWKTLTPLEISAAAQSMLGLQVQTPPVYSAKKVGGTPSHRRVRRGESVELEPRQVSIHRLDVLSIDPPDITFATTVSSGTYVRALARDLGDRMGTSAHLVKLRRLSVGAFRVEGAHTARELDAGRAGLRPPGEALLHLESVELTEDQAMKVSQGQSLSLATGGEGLCALLRDGDLVAVAETAGELIRPRVVL